MGTAFGLMGSLESCALAFFPLIAASIVTSADSPEKGYTLVGFFFTGISLFLIVLIKVSLDSF